MFSLNPHKCDVTRSFKRVIFSGRLCFNDINTGRCNGFCVECLCHRKLLSFLMKDHILSSSALSSTYVAVYLNRWCAQTLFSLDETTVKERSIFLLLLMTQNVSQYLKLLPPSRINHLSSFSAFGLFENVKESSR